MRIIKLTGENFKRMVAFDITPKGNTVVVSGRNGQGKTSVLDSIAFAIEGKSGNVGKLTTKPIREGEKRASVSIQTEEFTITRTWVKNDDGGFNDYLEITSKDGLKFPSPQTVLNKIVGDLTFDPLEFARMKSKDQKELLLRTVNMGTFLEDWEEAYKQKYEERRMVGVKANELRATLNSMPKIESPNEEVSISKLSEELSHAMRCNETIRTNQKKEADLYDAISEMEKDLEKMKSDLALVHEQNEKMKMMDTEGIQKQIRAAEQTNHNVRGNKEREKIAKETERRELQHGALETEINQLVDAKNTMLEEANFPVPGLGIDDDCVTFNGVPFAQCSDAEKLKVSMAIAMAANPKFRFIRITDGSLLDDDNMKVLEEMADKNDFQIWVERVDSDAKVGVIIEDGMVVSPQEE